MAGGDTWRLERRLAAGARWFVLGVWSIALAVPMWTVPGWSLRVGGRVLAECIAATSGVDVPLDAHDHLRRLALRIVAVALFTLGASSLVLAARAAHAVRAARLAPPGPPRALRPQRPHAASRRSRAAGPPPELPATRPALITLCVAVPSERRDDLDARLQAVPSVHALLAETFARAVAARDDEALVWLDVAAASQTDALALDATLARRTLDALVCRDVSHHEAGYRDAAWRSTRKPGHAVLAIAIVARDVVLRSFDRVDRAQLSNVVGGLLPIASEALIHHAYRFVPDDEGRAFDDATLRATFPELRPV